jgi:hypothetical protein
MDAAVLRPESQINVLHQILALDVCVRVAEMRRCRQVGLEELDHARPK